MQCGLPLSDVSFCYLQTVPSHSCVLMNTSSESMLPSMMLLTGMDNPDAATAANHRLGVASL